MNQLATINTETGELQTGQPTPMLLLQMAMEQGADLDRLERLMALQERWETNEAKKLFGAAFASFKSEAVQVIRTKEITDGPLKGKKHAELGGIVKAVSPALSKYGLSISWSLSKDDKDWMEVTCTLRHSGGHCESVSMGGAPDTGPGRNAIQARGSAKTYLERYTALAILGLAPEDDDDGRGGPSGVDVENLKTEMSKSKTREDLMKIFSDAWGSAKAVQDRAAMGVLTKYRDELWEKLK